MKHPTHLHLSPAGSPWRRFAAAALASAAALAAGGLNAAIEDGLVSYWPLDGDFEDAWDVNHGEGVGGAPIEFADGKFGQGIDLNGTDQYVLISGGDEETFDFTGGSMSVSVWFRVDAFTTDWQALVAKGEGDGWRTHRRGGETGMAFAGGTGDTPTGGPDVTDGEIHHLVGISDMGVGTFLYIDGELAAQGPADRPIEDRANRMRIGSNPDTNPGRFWNGMIDDVAVWNRALTADEVELLYNGGTGTSVGNAIIPPDDSAVTAYRTPGSSPTSPTSPPKRATATPTTTGPTT